MKYTSFVTRRLFFQHCVLKMTSISSRAHFQPTTLYIFRHTVYRFQRCISDFILNFFFKFSLSIFRDFCAYTLFFLNGRKFKTLCEIPRRLPLDEFYDWTRYDPVGCDVFECTNSFLVSLPPPPVQTRFLTPKPFLRSRLSIFE